MNVNSYILYLHRVGNKSEKSIYANKNMIITPSELEEFIITMKVKHTFISLDELLDCLNQNKVPKNVILLTFDDGYLDNYTNAYPILKYYNIPFTIYISSQFINTNILPWWYQLEQLICKNDNYFTFNKEKYHFKNLNDKNECFLNIRKKAFSSHQNMQNLITLLGEHSYNSETIFLNWGQINELNNDNLVTIGAHTHTHPNLANLDGYESEYEINHSKVIIENNINITVNHFAYPYGGPKNYSQREINSLFANKFTTGVTTKFGFLNKQCFENRFELPRIMLGSDFFTFRRKIHRLYRLYN